MPLPKPSLVILWILAEIANAADYATTAVGHVAYGFGEANPLMAPGGLSPSPFLVSLTIKKSIVAAVLVGILWVGAHARPSWGPRLSWIVPSLFLAAVGAYGYATAHAVRGMWTMWLILHTHR